MGSRGRRDARERPRGRTPHGWFRRAKGDAIRNARDRGSVWSENEVDENRGRIPLDPRAGGPVPNLLERVHGELGVPKAYAGLLAVSLDCGDLAPSGEDRSHGVESAVIHRRGGRQRS